MSDTRAFREATIRTVTESQARSSADARRAAFANDGVAEPARALVAKVVEHAYTITDDDVHAAAKALGEDEVLELVVCAAIGQATRQLDAALAVLAEAEV
jgi:hypothetical protein